MTQNKKASFQHKSKTSSAAWSDEQKNWNTLVMNAVIAQLVPMSSI